MRKGFDERYRAETDGMVKLRMAATKMYLTPKEDGSRYTLRDVAHALGMSIGWVSKTVSRYRKNGIPGLYDRPRPGAPRRIDHDAVKEILAGWKTGKLTSRKIAQLYRELTGESLSPSYARQIACSLGFKSKKPRKLRSNSASPSAVRGWQEYFVVMIEALMEAGYVLAAGDEASFQLDQTANAKYYAPPGKAAVTVTNEGRGKITAVGLVTMPDEKTGRSHRLHVFGRNPNSKLFIELCKKALKKFGLVIMVVDNASWHISREVRDFVEEQDGALLIIPLPRSSPYLNVKEGDWRQAKMDEYFNDYAEDINEFKRRLVIVLNFRLSRRRDVLAGLKRSPYKHNERSFVGLSTHPT